jgi:hypothetical protein
MQPDAERWPPTTEATVATDHSSDPSNQVETHRSSDCYQCTGLPGFTDVSDEWKRWALDFRPKFLPPRERAA